MKINFFGEYLSIFHKNKFLSGQCEYIPLIEDNFKTSISELEAKTACVSRIKRDSDFLLIEIFLDEDCEPIAANIFRNYDDLEEYDLYQTMTDLEECETKNGNDYYKILTEQVLDIKPLGFKQQTTPKPKPSNDKSLELTLDKILRDYVNNKLSPSDRNMVNKFAECVSSKLNDIDFGF